MGHMLQVSLSYYDQNREILTIILGISRLPHRIRFVPKEPQKPEPDKLHAIDRHWAYSTIPVPLWQTA